MKRRDFVSVFSASLGATMLWSCRKDIIDPVAEPAENLLARPGAVTTRYPLRVPNTVAANGQVLTCKTATTDIGGGKLSNVWTYDGDYPARTLIASNGSNVDITMVNHLPEETITHWHGMIVDHMNDGGPMLHVPTGGSYHYNFTIRQRAALNWYHPHPHMLTGEQVCLGLAGAFVYVALTQTSQPSSSS